MSDTITATFAPIVVTRTEHTARVSRWVMVNEITGRTVGIIEKRGATIGGNEIGGPFFRKSSVMEVAQSIAAGYRRNGERHYR